jgi:HTH-type transcriptional regulator/antitoxin HigA
MPLTQTPFKDKRTDMNIRPIKTEADYKAVLVEIDRLMDAEPDTPAGDRLDVLTTLAEAYEAKNHPIEEPDPVEAILHRMDALGLTRKDLEPLLGTRARVSEVLARKRPLTIAMIRRVHQSLQIPTDILIQAYRLKESRT